MTPGQTGTVASPLLSQRDLDLLVEASRRLERHCGRPQDVEWAIDREGELYILQTRAMVVPPPLSGTVPSKPDVRPLLQGGHTACPGTGAGAVFQVRSDTDLDRFPTGGVLVSRHSSPAYSRLMNRCRAVVTDVGSPIGHMAILAREFGVPAIVGLEDATQKLEHGRFVTVHATDCAVYDGEIPGLTATPADRAPLAGSPAVQRLEVIAGFVTPLNLVNPHALEFAPAHCRTLHDVTRFIHEKVYHAMFRIGDLASHDTLVAYTLEAALPLTLRLFNLGDGIRDTVEAGSRIKPGDILSAPMAAFLEGLLDPRIRWNQPRPVSARGFLSVLGQGMAGPPPEAQGVGSTSYAVISDRYMNFSTKTGYHFSTIDCYCGQSQNKNYIHFRFAGGGAGEDRRARRIRFLSGVLDNLDFRIQVRGDRLVARLEKYDADFIRTRLTDLGRLTLCARQLDMLMDTDDSPTFFAQLFLRGEMDRF